MKIIVTEGQLSKIINKGILSERATQHMTKL